MRSASREALDAYLNGIKSYRSFRLVFDSSAAAILEQLQQCG